MGFFQRLIPGMGASSSKASWGMLIGFPESIVQKYSSGADLTQKFPSVPKRDLNVMVAFVRVGAVKTGRPLPTDAQLNQFMETLCRDYRSGSLEVRKTGTELQLWQKGDASA